MGAPRHDDKDSIVHFQQSMLYGVRLACLCCSEIGVYTAPAGSAPAIVGLEAPASSIGAVRAPGRTW